MAIHRHIKRWFVPHKQNDHRPHLIRVHGLAVMALLIMGVQASALALHSAPVPLVRGHVLDYALGSISPVDLLTQTNQQRAANGVGPLRMDARLNNSAGMKAQDMFANDYWAHVSPSGVQPWFWFTKAGYVYSYAGENLAMDFDTTSGVMDGWMNSPGHKANILNPHYTDVGFAVENGTLVGEQTTLVVAHYGAQAPVAAPVAAAAPPAALIAKAATPTPTPAATPAPTDTPSPQLTPTPTPTSSPHAVVATGKISAAPAAKSFSLFRPLSLTRTASLSTLVTLGLLLVLLFVYLYTHLTVWGKGLKRWRRGHYRLYAAAQLSGLTIAIISLAAAGFGKVG